jgi:uncharacterized membrane protein
MNNPGTTPPADDRAATSDLLGWTQFKMRFRSRMVAGLILLIPIWITIVIVRFIFGLLRDASLWIIEWFLRSPTARPVLAGWGLDEATIDAIRTQGVEAFPTGMQWFLAAMSVFLTIALLYIFGGVTANVFGRRAIWAMESLLDRVPLVKTVYRATKQVLDMLAGGETSKPFQRVVSIPFPSAQVRTIGFVTHETRDAATGDELYTVFLASTPNPTTGFVFILRKTDVVELDWNVENAVKVVMSGGVLIPDQIPSLLPIGTQAAP